MTPSPCWRSTVLLLFLVEVEGQQLKRVGSWMEWRAQSGRVTFASCMDEMRQTHGQLEPSDVFFLVYNE